MRVLHLTPCPLLLSLLLTLAPLTTWQPANLVTVQVGLAWLNRWATNTAGKDQAGVLCLSIASQLVAAQQTGLGADEVAAQLLDLLGDAAFEQVGALLERR